MRSMRFVELVANVKANIVAFFSIAMFVALGVGLLLGIQWGNDALLNAMGEEVEAGAMHDIEVQFPYGVTADNLDELKGVEGVSQLEYGYTSYASMIDGNEGYTLKFQSITPTIDRHTRVMGSMPVEKNEIALLRSWAEGKGVNVGDELTLKHDVPKGDASDADGMRYLTTDTFTITGLVDNPAYVSTSEGSLGVTNIGSGTVDCVGFVTEQAFDMSALADGYTNVYIRSDAVRGMQTTSNEYRETLAPIVQRVEELGKRLGSAQYNKVHGQAQSKLSDAERQLADGERQLTEGQQRIADGEREIAEGREKLESGQQELVESVGSAANEQSSAQSKLESAYRQLADAQARFDAGIDQYTTASELYNQINSKFESVHSTYDTFIALYTRLREMQAALLTSISSYDRTVSAWESGGAAWTEVEDAYSKVGDSIELKEFTGKTHSFRIAGFFDYYLLRAECVLSPYTYREAFGELPESNVLLIDTDGSDKSALRDSLLGVEGFNTLVDDYQRASYNYDELTRILRTVVLVYLLLSGLMAVVVLLNLDIMFVSEKKRELIVLMINGYSVKDAKAYIYRDSIVLTVIGIGLGIVVGSVVGSYTVFSLEPETGYFVKGFSLISAVVGAVGAGVFSMVVLMFALRLIARFELTDINRF